MRLGRIVALALLALTAMGVRAEAIEVQCIEASRYKHLWRIFNGDSAKFAAYLMIDAAKLPDPELCRAAIVTGPIVQNMDAGKFLDFILQNKGWLSTVYLASPGGNVGEGIKLGYLVRSFWLKTEAISSVN